MHESRGGAGRWVHICASCRGIWFGPGDLAHEIGVPGDFPPSPVAGAALASAPALRCPRCAPELLVRRGYGAGTLAVATCQRCQGVWLERGQLREVTAVALAHFRPVASAAVPRPTVPAAANLSSGPAAGGWRRLPQRAPWLLPAALLIAAAWWSLPWSGDLPPRPYLPDEPWQGPPPRPASWSKGAYRITALASYKARALVLRAERYRFDRGAALAPVDLALGWRAMSRPAVVNKLSIRQSWRFYFVAWQTPPVPEDEIFATSANTHMIPATPEVERQLLRVRRGDIVDFEGELVEVEGEGGFRWRSSLTRQDRGDGSCELVWVRRLASEPN